MKTLHVAVARHLRQIFESIFYRFSSPCFTDFRVRFTDFRVRVLQIFESSPVQSMFYKYSPVRVLQHAVLVRGEHESSVGGSPKSCTNY